MAELSRRVWSVTVGTKFGELAVGLKVTKLRCAFDIEKDLTEKPNSCTLRIWGLSPQHRAAIVQQRATDGKTKGIPVRIEAGYEATGPFLLYSGDLRFASNTKEGPSWVTTIESGDGEAARQNARIRQAFGPGTTADKALGAAVRALGLSEGNTAKFLAKLRSNGTAQPGRVVLSGSAWLHAYQIAKANGLEFSVQDGVVQLTEQGRVIPGRSVKLSAATGLIGSPVVDHKGILSATSLLQDGLQPGRLVVMDGATVKGNFKIQKTKLTGDSHGQEWYAEIEGKRY